MTQFDMVVTQWAFVGPALIFPHRLGMSHVPEEQFEALSHQMYLIGRELGVRDEYNLCKGSLHDVRAYCRAVHKRVIKRGLESHDGQSETMAKHLLEGLHMYNAFIWVRPFQAWTARIFQVIRNAESLSYLLQML